MDFLTARRDRIAKAWALQDEMVLLPAGGKIPMPGTDEFYPFRATAEHRYLADMNEPGRVLAYDAKIDAWTLFAPRVPVEEEVWHGAVPAVGRPLEELDAFIAGRSVRNVPEDRTLTTAITLARRIKDDEELDRLRRAAAATAAGFAEARRLVQPGMRELALEAELEVSYLRAGGSGPAFDSIVASGNHAAVLHHQPGDDAIEDGEFLLIDSGSAFGGYSCDCTRTFVVAEQPTEEQRRIHNIVLQAQQEAVAECRAGVEYSEIHRCAVLSMAQGLIDWGLLRGDPARLLESGATALFFPHGVGHLIGLATHDPGGYACGRVRNEHVAWRYLRADLPLEAGMVVTIEPGLYFIEALLQDPALRDRHADEVNWEQADALLGIGGVRIEDSVVITDGEPEVLTAAIPKDL
ncbi:MAG: aminopeptidase P N-terminal domain-containing protein [Planctomycetota bacterium]